MNLNSPLQNSHSSQKQYYQQPSQFSLQQAEQSQQHDSFDSKFMIPNQQKINVKENYTEQINHQDQQRNQIDQRNNNDMNEEQKIKDKLMRVFQNDKRKLIDFCDHFVQKLRLVQSIQNIHNLIEFFDQVIQYKKYQDGDQENFRKNQSKNQHKNDIKRSNLTNIQEKFEFLSQAFSKDKVKQMIQGLKQYKKISIFLLNLKASLLSIQSQIQTEWIQLKDNLIRKIHKYINNIDIFLLNSSGISKKSNKNNIFSQEFTTKRYKLLLNKIKAKINQIQTNQSSLIQKSVHDFTFQATIMKNRLNFKIRLIQYWLDKISKIQNSLSKQNGIKIFEILSEFQKKFVEGVIILQNIQKHVIEFLGINQQKVSKCIRQIKVKLTANNMNVQGQQFQLKDQKIIYID